MSLWRREVVRGDDVVPVSLERTGDRLVVQVGDTRYAVADVQTLPDGGVRFRMADGESSPVHTAFSAAQGKALQVRVDGFTRTITTSTGRDRGGAGGGDGTVLAPMTGTVLEVSVAVGDTVTADQTVAVVSAMKMEHKLTAGIDGTVTAVGAEAGANVEQGDVLVQVEAAE